MGLLQPCEADCGTVECGCELEALEWSDIEYGFEVISASGRSSTIEFIQFVRLRIRFRERDLRASKLRAQLIVDFALPAIQIALASQLVLQSLPPMERSTHISNALELDSVSCVKLAAKIPEQSILQVPVTTL